MQYQQPKNSLLTAKLIKVLSAFAIQHTHQDIGAYWTQ